MAPRWNRESGHIEMAWPQGLVYRFPVSRWRKLEDGLVEWYDAGGSETITCDDGAVFVRFISGVDG